MSRHCSIASSAGSLKLSANSGLGTVGYDHDRPGVPAGFYKDFFQLILSTMVSLQFLLYCRSPLIAI